MLENKLTMSFNIFPLNAFYLIRVVPLSHSSYKIVIYNIHSYFHHCTKNKKKKKLRQDHMYPT